MTSYTIHESPFTQGSHASWKILAFLLENFQDLASPGNYLQGPGKPWNLPDIKVRMAVVRFK